MTLVAAANGPMSFDGSFRRSWISWRRKVSGPWLHPVGFFQYVDISGPDPSKWRLLKVRTTYCSFREDIAQNP